ncbi:MAG TPA: cupredoxin domain-containing protein [Solirubrobacteraceae bacterium]
MRRAVPLLALALAPAFVAVSAQPAAARTARVVIEDIDFTPGTVRIHRGDRVRWVWRDGITPHDVTSRGRHRFRSSRTKSSGSHRVRFRHRGTYRYVCTIHLGMDGKVVVR